MIRNILLLLAMVMASAFPPAAFGSGFPDPQGKSREQMFKEIQEFKLKYLAQEIKLEENQREPFFKLYNEMSEKRMALMREARSAEKAVRGNKDATDEDYMKATKAMDKAKADDAAIEKEYDAKFSKILTHKQIYELKRAEESFRRKMDEMRHRGNNKKHKK